MKRIENIRLTSGDVGFSHPLYYNLSVKQNMNVCFTKWI